MSNDIFTYEVKDEHIVITGLNEKAAPAENLVIPQIIDKKPVTEIGRCAFRKVEALKSVEMPSITEIGDWAFSGCINLTTALMPVATKLGERAFNGCSSLYTIEAKAVEVLQKFAFAGCNSIESLSLDNAKVIGFRSFSECKKLRSVNLPRVETIADWAFCKCPLLRDVTMPKADLSKTQENKALMSVMGWNAFYGCKSLSELTFYTNAPEIDRPPISECGPVVRPGDDNDPAKPRARRFTINFARGTTGWDSDAWRFYERKEF